MKYLRYKTVLLRIEERLDDVRQALRARVDEHSAWEKGYNDALEGEIQFLERMLNFIKAIEKPLLGK